MIPKTEQDKQMVRLSIELRRARKMGDDFKKWAINESFDDYIAVFKNGKGYCTHCHHQVKLPKQVNYDNARYYLYEDDKAHKIVCPHCGRSLQYLKQDANQISTESLINVMQTYKGWQVFRTFEIRRHLYIGMASYNSYDVKEAQQLWLNSDGTFYSFSLRNQVFSSDFSWNGDLMLLKSDNKHHIIPNMFRFNGLLYPEKEVIPELTRNGFDGCFPNNTYLHQYAIDLLSIPFVETLTKLPNKSYLNFYYEHRKGSDTFLPSMKIAIRNNYEVNETWLDNFKYLIEFKLDLHSPKYVCPEDLEGLHQMLIKRHERKAVKEEKERRRLELLSLSEKNDSAYKRKKKKFLKLIIKEGTLTAHVLQNVNEFFDEGVEMHHCVFDCRYFNKDESLIFSVRDSNDNRVETVEINLETMKIVQSRGHNNHDSEHHEQIIRMMNDNMDKIRECKNSKKRKPKKESVKAAA
jgi:hypothetical protein